MISIHAGMESRGLHFDLDHGKNRTLAIVGRNGTGKSTLIGLLAGLVKPESGTVDIKDMCVAGPTWVPPHERPIALLSQDPSLFPHLSVLDNVTFGPRARGVNRDQAETRARGLLRRVDCADLEDRQPDQLSGGQAQRVALARALAVDPEIVLLDEPLAAMDVAGAASLREMLKDALSGRTGVIVTHDMADVSTLADDVAVLAGGNIHEYGPAHELMNNPDSMLRQHFLGF